MGAAAVMLSEKADAGYAGVVKMRGLPFHATVHDIEAFFGASYRIAPHGIYITTGADGRLTGALLHVTLGWLGWVGSGWVVRTHAHAHCLRLGPFAHALTRLLGSRQLARTLLLLGCLAHSYYF